ncbi:YtxH domain-containing protein [Arcticibacter sp. MXS-1]|uniref:YtxH domain-containing protein n=1 Tax=Arcticibacter sp. MXS-1 TaxID=3341726 RepID=UPI0035A90F99
MKNRSTIAGVVLAGLATGAAAWYLFGTSNGKEVCNKLMSSVKDMSGSMKDMSSSVMDKAHDTISQLSDRVNGVSDRVMA